MSTPEPKFVAAGPLVGPLTDEQCRALVALLDEMRRSRREGPEAEDEDSVTPKCH
jgi:hypothetical protein